MLQLNKIQNRLKSLIVIPILAGIVVSALFMGSQVSNAYETVDDHDEDILTLENSSGGRSSFVSVDLTNPDDNYSAVLYNNSNGLPTSEANAIAQTADGFIWIGSYSGLVRYDGNTFERMGASTGITSVNTLYVDRYDRLWIGTNESGVFMMDRGNISRWDSSSGLAADAIRDIVADGDGVMYFATTSGVSLMGGDMVMKTIEDSVVKGAVIECLRVDNEGMIYGNTNDGNVFTLENGCVRTFIEASSTPLEGVTRLMPDPERSGWIYCETKGGKVYRANFNTRLNTSEKIDTNGLTQIQCFEYIDGRVWICARNGIGILMDDGYIYNLKLPLTNSVGNVMTDYSGNLWFSSSRQGVMKVVPNYFEDTFEAYSIPSEVVNSTCEYDGCLFCGTDNGLIVINWESGPVNEVPLTKAQSAKGFYLNSDNLVDLLAGVRIRSIIKDSKDRLWISTWRKYGVLRYDHGEVMAFNVEEGLFSDHVRTVYEREDGSFLVVNMGGVNVIRGNRVVESYGEKDGLVNTEILSATEGFNGEIIAGSDGAGIYILKDGRCINLSKKDGLTSEAIMKIKRDEEHRIYWIVTGNSLAYMTEDYKIVTLDKFPYSNNLDIVKNSSDEIWVLSSNGIYIMTAEELMANNETLPEFYGPENGLPYIATANSYSYLDPDGILYIAGNTGVCSVNVEARISGISDVKVAVPFVDADNERIYPDEDGAFIIPAGTKKLTIYSYVFNYSLVGPMVVYKLDGFDEEAMVVKRSDLRPLTYTNLPGGSYTFVLRITDAMGREGKGMLVEINKDKAITEEPWFYILTVTGIVMIVILCLRLYISKRISALERKHKEQAEKERLGTELEMAKRIQSSVLPHEFPPFPDRKEFDIYASMDPAKEVSGDFYDFYFIDDDHLCMTMADVSGKGIPASLFMMISKIVLKNNAMLGQAAADILSRSNTIICAENSVEMFVTVWLGVLEISTGKITAVNAGHEYPVIMQDGRFELMKDKHGFVVGGMEGMKYKSYEFYLKPGDKIFLYTDGVPEATDAGNEMFGTDRMLEALNKNPYVSPEQILINVRNAVDSFVKDAEQFDDLTMLCLEYKGPAASEDSDSEVSES